MSQQTTTLMKKTKSSPNLVNEEYSRALHTKSFVELYSRVHQHQLNRNRSSSSLIDVVQEEKKLRQTYSSPLSDRHYSEEETSSRSIAFKLRNPKSKTSALLLDFFDTTLKSSSACASLLTSIDRARSHHRSIHRHLLALSSTTSPSAVFPEELPSLLALENPLSAKTLAHFHHIHSLYPPLILRLTSAHRRLTRRLKLVRATKTAAGVAAIAIVGAMVAVAAVLASHGAAAAAAAPLASSGWCMMRGRRLGLEKERARVDAAKKGAYIVGRDLDTMGQMVRRVHDEVEHGRDVGRMVVGNYYKEWGMVREVVKEMERRRGEVGLGFEEQLEELEEHVYLCLITINRSRRLVAEEMMERENES